MCYLVREKSSGYTRGFEINNNNKKMFQKTDATRKKNTEKNISWVALLPSLIKSLANITSVKENFTFITFSVWNGKETCNLHL